MNNDKSNKSKNLIVFCKTFLQKIIYLFLFFERIVMQDRCSLLSSMQEVKATEFHTQLPQQVKHKSNAARRTWVKSEARQHSANCSSISEWLLSHQRLLWFSVLKSQKLRDIKRNVPLSVIFHDTVLSSNDQEEWKCAVLVASVDEVLLNTALDMPLNFMALMMKIILRKCDN